MEKNNDDDDDGNNWRMCVCVFVICESDYSDRIGKTTTTNEIENDNSAFNDYNND